jgi:hypothetical protein
MQGARIICAAALLAVAGCAGGAPSQGVVANPVAASPQALSPALKLQPRELHFNLQHPKSKTEKVLGYNPGGSYHTDCSTLGIATIAYEHGKGRNADFLISPLHEGKCEVGFVHAPSGKTPKTKTLPIIVNE